MGLQCSLYNVCFFLYVFIVPAFLMYLMRAPSTFDSAPFHPVPLHTLQGNAMRVNMSRPPQTMEPGVSRCKPCYEDQYSKQGFYQWDLELSMSYADLIHFEAGRHVNTLYPVILASNDFRTWKVVADADDVASGAETVEDETTHISPPLLVAGLKPFGCESNESATTDPYKWYFASEEMAEKRRWKLVDHISRYGEVNLVACVVRGWTAVQEIVSHHVQECMDAETGEVKCEQTARQALGRCHALGSACGRACGFFSPRSGSCHEGMVDPSIFAGLTRKRVKIKTEAGGSAAEALVSCSSEFCKIGVQFEHMYVEAENPNEFMMQEQQSSKENAYYTLVFAMSDVGSHGSSEVQAATEAETEAERRSSGSAEDDEDEQGDGQKAAAGPGAQPSMQDQFRLQAQELMRSRHGSGGRSRARATSAGQFSKTRAAASPAKEEGLELFPALVNRQEVHRPVPPEEMMARYYAEEQHRAAPEDIAAASRATLIMPPSDEDSQGVELKKGHRGAATNHKLHHQGPSRHRAAAHVASQTEGDNDDRTEEAAAFELQDVCPPGWAASSSDINGVGKKWMYDLDLPSCAQMCDARPGCPGFEFYLRNGTCGTYLEGLDIDAQGSQVEGWATCFKEITWDDLPERRGCIAMPGVKLAEEEGALLTALTADGASPAVCADECKAMSQCEQMVFSFENSECYLFTGRTTKVEEFSALYNSSFCGRVSEMDSMMQLLHEAYSQPRPGTEKRRLAAREQVFAWHLAHVPNLTVGVLKDRSSNTMNVRPQKESCFVQPGFAYLVACMTPKPVFMSGYLDQVEGPPFNDRCIAVSGVCGATCGSIETLDEDAAKYCPVGQSFGRTLRSGRSASPYETAVIPQEFLVSPVEPRSSATSRSLAARFFFNGFIFFMVLSYVATILSRFPGNFQDFYPYHTWDEIKTHGYVLENFGCAVACGVSATESKMIVFRNWIGRVAARPEFDDNACPTFRRWVDLFCDEGHREGARLLWAAWTDFLDTSPPAEFIEAWSNNTRDLTWDQAAERSPFDLAWTEGGANCAAVDVEGRPIAGGKVRKVLPVVARQADLFVRQPGEEVPAGGFELAQDSLARLSRLFAVFNGLPSNMKFELSQPCRDDCVLTREVRLSLRVDGRKASDGCFTVKTECKWRQQVEENVKILAQSAGCSQEECKRSMMVTSASGQPLESWQSDEGPGAGDFPLHFRSQVHKSRGKDCKVFMIYIARAKPESDRRDLEKTRGLDKYLFACLRPSWQPATQQRRRRNDSGTEGSSRSQMRSLQRVSQEEKAPLMGSCGVEVGCCSMDEADSLADKRPGMDFARVRRCVEEVAQRQQQEFLARVRDAASLANPGACEQFWGLRQELTREYMKHRRMESDWELARFCHGEIVGEDCDVNGDEVLILDNPSPALLELASERGSGGPQGMGLVVFETVEELTCFKWLRRDVIRIAGAAELVLELVFYPTDESPDPPPDSYTFEDSIREALRDVLPQRTSQDGALGGGGSHVSILTQQHADGSRFMAEMRGPCKILENVKQKVAGDFSIMGYRGAASDGHPTVLVRKDMLMPYCGVRGKGGSLNYAVDMLQFRSGFIGAAEGWDPTPERMLFGIFDARHQPHPDFWQMCLPKFVREGSAGFTYEVNKEVTLVQAPQHFAALSADDDVLDVLNGAAFNIMNVIRDRCGGVTSCGTNGVWQIDAGEFTRSGSHGVDKEYFDSRTKIEDTASSHLHFCKGKRSVYVHETVSTGIAKVNADYLGAVQRWSEGAVQLFWVQLFVDRIRQLVVFGWSLILFVAFILGLLYSPWPNTELLGDSLFCAAQGEQTVFFGPKPDFCDRIYHFYAVFLQHNIDRVVYKMAEREYMSMIDMQLTWLSVCLLMCLLIFMLSRAGAMPKIVRTFIMMENITYFWTSCGTFFWIALSVFMVVGRTPPLMFNVSHFALFVLGIKVTEHCMLNQYRGHGGATELSIWRSQQSYVIAAPLYIMSILQGSAAAWGITWRRQDKSFWSASDHGAEVIRLVTVWVTFIWIIFILCVFFTVIENARYEMLHQSADRFQRQCQIGACFMLGIVAMTVWEPFLTFWGFDKVINSMGKAGRGLAGALVWWRSKAWIVRYMADFALPIIILSGATGGTSIVYVLLRLMGGEVE